MTLVGHRNTATTKKLDYKNSNLTSVGATFKDEVLSIKVDDVLTVYI
jgi:hypothetical protein